MIPKRLIFLSLCGVLIAKPTQAITIDVVPIDNSGNANDPATGNRFGAVAYEYNIGKYDITVGQYTAFLNAVAATDTYGLYNTSMATDLNIAGISRDGTSGGYSYSVIGSANHPITYASWGDAARFCNWLSNGQPTGIEGPNTTETGTYTLEGAVTDGALNTITRNANAKWFIPTESEWYKAAFYDALAGHYWNYDTGTNATPTSAPPSGTPNTANFYGNTTGYAVTGSRGLPDPNQNYLTDVGAYTASASPYGTFDQGGDVFQWNETLLNSLDRGVRGTSWGNRAEQMASSYQGGWNPTAEFGNVGFRVAEAQIVPGDFNGNGIVDAADYTVWRDTLGSTTDLRANGDNTGPSAGKIDQADFNVWKSNFGLHAGGGASDAVPEPNTQLLAIVACGATLWFRKRFSP